MPNINAPTPDATPTSKGKIQLAGDLAGTAAAPMLANGAAIQVRSTVTSAVATGTTIIPEDDTIPQITEGDEYITVSITPKATTNILVIEAVVFMSFSVAADLIVALFQDSTSNALAVDMLYMSTGTGMATINLKYTMVAGTTSATTFRIRAGGHLAGTTTLNGQSGARKFGTASKSSLIVTEYRA